MSSAGNASIAVLIIFFAISVIFVSAAAFSGGLIRLTCGVSDEYQEKEFLAGEAQKIIERMKADPTPEADSKLDPVWAEVALPSTPGIEITLEDISSKINPNAEVDNLLQAMNLFKPEKLFEEFQKFRKENGPLTDIRNSYSDYIKEDALEQYCTEYAYFNINTADENMLFRLFEARTGKMATATTFPEYVRASKTNKQLITSQNIKEALGADWNDVYPFIDAEAELNVNLVDKAVLDAVLNVAKNVYKIELRGDVSAAILDLRSQSEITPAMLASVIQPKFKDTILEAYLGCRTWFWRLSVVKDTLQYNCVVARLPAAGAEKEKAPRFRLVEEDYLRVPQKADGAETVGTHE